MKLHSRNADLQPPAADRPRDAGLKIERGIPPPEHPDRGGRPSKFCFADLEVGESVLVPTGYATNKELAYACSYLHRKFGRKFIRKANSAGVRVWRLA